MRRLSIALGCAAAIGAVAVPARADPNASAPKSITHEYSAYEKESIANALKATGRIPEPDPEGKIVEGVDVVTLDVFEKRDPIPTFFNVFHWTSRPYTISRELLLKPGDAYRKVIVDETARNLRSLSAQLSLVLAVPVKGSKPGTVRVLLITKDVWSLRLNSSFSVVGGRFESLVLQPSEQNVFGTHHVAAAQFTMLPLSYALGGYYRIPWLFGTRVQGIANADVVINRETGNSEGSYGGLVVRKPLFSTRTDWAWDVRGEWTYDVYRLYRNARLATYDARVTPEPDGIPWLFRRSLGLARASVTRSYGWALKHDLTFGAELNERSFRTYDMSAYDPAAVREFIDRRVPVSDRRVGPFAQYRTYRTDFLRVLDVEILGLQEDFRLGHDFVAKVYPVFKDLGASRNFLGVDARLQYTVALHDGFARGLIEGLVEAQPDRVSDAKVEGRLRVVSPRTIAGRLVFDAGLVRRFRNFLNELEYLGSNVRPRGYATRSIVGANAVAYTFEWRTRALEILKTQWGLVGFYDAGDAYDTTADLEMKHSVGVGVRALFPQFDRVAFRLDVGFPIKRGGLPPGVAPYGVILTVGQAFEVPNVLTAASLE